MRGISSTQICAKVCVKTPKIHMTPTEISVIIVSVIKILSFLWVQEDLEPWGSEDPPFMNELGRKSKVFIIRKTDWDEPGKVQGNSAFFRVIILPENKRIE